MSQKFENVSALVDGEASASGTSDSPLLEAVLNDNELMQKWNNYHLIRDTLRKELPKQLDLDIANQVAIALQSEPVILAPKRKWHDLPLVSNVVPFAKQGGQMAIAASVAVAMILGVQQFNHANVEQPFNAAPPILGIQGGLSPVSLEQTRALPRTDVAEQRRILGAYLSDHKQQMRLKSHQSMDMNISVADELKTHKEAQSDVVDNLPE
jgi:sigma-E factor negative regulatory protein RseA